MPLPFFINAHHLFVVIQLCFSCCFLLFRVMFKFSVSCHLSLSFLSRFVVQICGSGWVWFRRLGPRCFSCFEIYFPVCIHDTEVFRRNRSGCEDKVSSVLVWPLSNFALNPLNLDHFGWQELKLQPSNILTHSCSAFFDSGGKFARPCRNLACTALEQTA